MFFKAAFSHISLTHTNSRVSMTKQYILFVILFSLYIGIFGYNAHDEIELHTSQDFLKENITFINISLGFPFQLAQGGEYRI